MQCSFQLSQVSFQRISNGIHFFHSIYCSYTHVNKNPVARLQEHWANSSPCDNINWFPASLPFFEPLHWTLMAANSPSSESQNHQGLEGTFKIAKPIHVTAHWHPKWHISQAQTSRPTYSYIWDKIGVCEEFRKFLCFAPLSRSTVSYKHLQYFQFPGSAEVPALLHFPGQHARHWGSSAAGKRTRGQGFSLGLPWLQRPKPNAPGDPSAHK